MSDRSRLLVDPQVQWSITLRVLFHWTAFLVCLVSVGAMFRILGSPGSQPWGDAWKSALSAQIPTLGVMFLMLPVFLRDTLKMSNRFAGPMYRLRTALAELAKTNETKPIKFRTGDYWLEVADDFNEAFGKLDELKKENRRLRAILAEHEDAVEV